MKKDNFTSFDFICLFTGIYASQKNFEFDRDQLVDFIKECKDMQLFNNLLSEFNIKTNGVTYYSQELEEEIQKLRLGFILYTISPEKDSTIYIFEDTPIDLLLKGRMNNYDEMIEFITKLNTKREESLLSKQL